MRQEAPPPMGSKTTPAAGDGMWTIYDVAAHLDVTHEVVRRWIRAGELRAYKYGPKLIRIDPADVRRMARPIGPQKSAPAPATTVPPAPPAARRAPTPARTSPTPAASLPAYATPAPRGIPRAQAGGAR